MTPSAARRKLALEPGDPQALSALAGAHQAIDLLVSSRLYSRAFAVTGAGSLSFMASRMAAAGVSFWHIAMVNDHRRNRAFAEAVRRTVGPGMVVLEIGLGSGLLSMVAAEAGARSVVGCEQSAAVAEAARRVISRNGYADRITIVPRRSTEITVGREMPEPADLIVAELVASDLLSEHIVPSVEDARARLARPGAAVVPRRAKIKAALVEMDAALALRYRLGSVEGFDLSAFSAFAPPTLGIPDDARPRRLSAVVDLLAFDFMAAAPIQPGVRTVAVPVERDGVAHGVLQWLELDLAPGVTFENRPSFADEPAPWSHWPAVFHFGYSATPVRPGETVVVEGQHNRTGILIVQHHRRAGATVEPRSRGG